IVIAGGLAEGAAEHLRRTLVIALVKFVVGLDHPARRIQKALAIGVFADVAEQGLHGLFGFSPRRTRLVGTNHGSHEFGRVELGRPGFGRLRLGRLRVRRLDIRSLAWAEGFDQRVHVNSARPALRPECHRQTGRHCTAGRLSPVSVLPWQPRWSDSGVPGPAARDWQLYFRHRRPYIGLWTAAAKGGDHALRYEISIYAERHLQQAHHRIGWQYTPVGATGLTSCLRNGALQAVRLDRQGGPQDGGACGHRLPPSGEGLRAGPSLLLDHGKPRGRLNGERIARIARDRPQ